MEGGSYLYLCACFHAAYWSEQSLFSVLCVGGEWQGEERLCGILGDQHMAVWALRA